MEWAVRKNTEILEVKETDYSIKRATRKRNDEITEERNTFNRDRIPIRYVNQLTLHRGTMN